MVYAGPTTFTPYDLDVRRMASARAFRADTSPVHRFTTNARPSGCVATTSCVQRFQPFPGRP